MRAEFPLRELVVDAGVLHFVAQGEGLPVVFVHGSLGDYRSWRSQIEPFSRRYRVIAYSRRYHYPNAWTGDGSDYSPGLHASDLAALIETIGSGPVIGIGSSYGAYVTLYLAAKRPELFRALVLGEPPILPWLEHLPGGATHLAAFQASCLQPTRLACRQGDLKRAVQTFIDGVNGQGTFEHLPPPAQSSLMDNARSIKVEMESREIFQAFTCDDVHRVQVPVLLAAGEDSPAMFHAINEELARCLPDRETVTIPHASHVMHQGNPQAYNQAVLEYLTRRTAQG